jgi:hypothetical protein
VKANWEFFGYVAAIIVGALIIARLVITIIRRIKAVGGVRGEPGAWERMIDRWDWKPFRPMFVVAAAGVFILTVLLLEKFFGLLTTVLPKNMPAEAQWYIDGAIAGALFMAVVLILATGYNAFATVMQSLSQDDAAPPGPDPVTQALTFADKVHQRDSERFSELIDRVDPPRRNEPPDA